MDDRPTLAADSILDPRIFLTVTLIVIQFSLLSAIGLAGGGFLALSPDTLERYGALVRALVWDKREYWRLGSAMFLHGGLFHFLLNAICLYFFGGPVEIALGRGRYLALYFAAGLTGNLASLLWGEPLGMSVGASGAIFGIVLAYLLLEIRGPTPWMQVVRQPASRMLFFLIGIQLAMGFFLRQIDSMAHWGGALTGATLGYFFVSGARKETARTARRWAVLAAWLVAFAILAATAGRPTVGAQRHVQIAFHYFLEGDLSAAMKHFDAATGADAPRAVSATDRLVGRYIGSPYRAPLAAGLLDLMDADKAAFDYYRARQERSASGDVLWLVATLAQKPVVADSSQALAACAEGKKRFARTLHWDLLEARVHAAFRRFDQALAILDRLEKATSQPLSANHWEIAALCRIRRHEWAEAERATSRCLSAVWTDLPALASGGRDLTVKDWRWRALKEMGRTSESLALAAEMEKTWRDVAAQSPDEPAALNNLAWHLATHGGDLDEALKLARRSVDAAPEAYNLDTLAWIEHVRGDQAAAWAAMERSLACRRSGAPEYFYHAGAILDALGKKPEARKYLERAVSPGVDFEEFDAAQAMLPREAP